MVGNNANVRTALILPQSFFARSVLEVAPELLGKVLIAPRGEGIITEVEAYDGPQDLACHARFGRTERTVVMFGPAGVWYVYLCYGMHFMLNIVTGDAGYPAAVLVRGVKRVKGRKGVKGDDELDGPGKVTKAMGIDGRFNGLPADEASRLFIEDRGIFVPDASIRRTPRIGVSYAGAWARKPYRFVYTPPVLSPVIS